MGRRVRRGPAKIRRNRPWASSSASRHISSIYVLGLHIGTLARRLTTHLYSRCWFLKFYPKIRSSFPRRCLGSTYYVVLRSYLDSWKLSEATEGLQGTWHFLRFFIVSVLPSYMRYDFEVLGASCIVVFRFEFPSFSACDIDRTSFWPVPKIAASATFKCRNIIAYFTK